MYIVDRRDLHRFPKTFHKADRLLEQARQSIKFGAATSMSAKPSLLIILRSPERIRAQYYNGIVQAFPEITVNAVSNVKDADPYLADADIIVTHGPHLDDRADNVFENARKLKWVQGIGTGVDGIIDRPTLRPDVIVTNIHGVHG